MTRRVVAFAGVGAMGCVVQLVAVALLTVAGFEPLLATCLAVEAAVLHNFAWHERWTWGDRTKNAGSVATRLLRFNMTTGLASIGGSALLIGVFVRLLNLNVILANFLTVGSLSVINFLIADGWVFAVVAAAVVFAGLPARAEASAPSAATIAAWDAFVRTTEARIDREARLPHPASPSDITGETIPIDDGLINHWTGRLFVPRVTLDEVMYRLATPGTPPPQEDVLASRVLRRSGNQYLHVYLRLTRRTIVTATYDTEHDVTFARLSPQLATSRSISTRIAEVGGGDRGFMWRLNSYWRYQQVRGGVLVEMESLTLSRGLPALLRPIALPIIGRVARESVTKTLGAFSGWFEPTPRPSA